jgi:hypothetical protein
VREGNRNANYRTTADAGMTLLLLIAHPWPRAAECGCWAADLLRGNSVC